MKLAYITITDALTGQTQQVPFTQDALTALDLPPDQAAFFALPTLEIHDGGSYPHPDGNGGNVADYRISVPAFVQREGSTYWIAASIGDIGQWTSMGINSPFDNHAGAVTVDTEANGTFRFVERDGSGSELQSVGPFTSQNP